LCRLTLTRETEYSLAFSTANFKTLVRAGIVLHVQTITVDATLEVGMTSEKVTVTATQPDLETETTDINSRFTANLIVDAHSINRSWMDLLASLPRINPAGRKVDWSDRGRQRASLTRKAGGATLSAPAPSAASTRRSPCCFAITSEILNRFGTASFRNIR